MGDPADILHPSHFIPPQQAGVLSEAAAEAETLGFLHPRQLDMIQRHDWFKIMIAREYGGKELDLPEVLKLEEGISWADGSTGWVVTLCSGAGWFSGFADEALARKVFAAPHVCIAGSGAPTGTAEKVDGGYRISGFWKYATGAPQATAFTANCVLMRNGRPVQNRHGDPVINSFILLPEEVSIHNHWSAMGMVATGTRAFEVESRIIPDNRRFDMEAAPRIDRPLFLFPFQQLAELTLAVNLSGLAMRFLDLAFEMHAEKTGGKSVRILIEEVLASLNVRRSAFHDAAFRSWESVSRTVNTNLLKSVTQRSLELAHSARRAVNEVYPFCGLAAAESSREINRVWRNLHTAGQHALFNRSANE